MPREAAEPGLVLLFQHFLDEQQLVATRLGKRLTCALHGSFISQGWKCINVAERAIPPGVFARRLPYLFSGLSKCGCAALGSSWPAELGSHASAPEKGTCDNSLTIRRGDVEVRVLKALQEKLLSQKLFEEFCEESRAR